MAAANDMRYSAPEEEKNQSQGGAQRWRVLGSFFRALKRFQSALNPTYEFGSFKHREDEGDANPNPALLKGNSGRVYSTPVNGTGLPHSASGRRTASGRTTSGRPTQGGVHHGHKGNMLFKPLPETHQTA